MSGKGNYMKLIWKMLSGQIARQLSRTTRVLPKSFRKQLEFGQIWIKWISVNITRLLCHGILQARILEWVAIPFSGDLPNPGIEPMSVASPALIGGFFTCRATGIAGTQIQVSCLLASGLFVLPHTPSSSMSLKSKWQRKKRPKYKGHIMIFQYCQKYLWNRRIYWKMWK